MADTISPIYAGAANIKDLVAALASNNIKSGQKNASELNFWSTPSRPMTDGTREVCHVKLNAVKMINEISFDLARFPQKVVVQYLDEHGKWVPLRTKHNTDVTASILDSLPAVIPPASPLNRLHSQHFGAGHWVSHNFDLANTSTSEIRVIMTRFTTTSAPKDIHFQYIPYSLGLRNFTVGYKTGKREDLPPLKEKPKKPGESVGIGTVPDPLGSPITVSVRNFSAAGLNPDQTFASLDDIYVTGTETTTTIPGPTVLFPTAHNSWKCEPQPIQNAVVSLHIDARDKGEPQVVDRFYVEPLTTGVKTNLYYSNDMLPKSFAFAGLPLPASATVMSDSVSISNTGIDFTQTSSSLDINNAEVKFDSSQPFWIGMTIQPSFNSTDANSYHMLFNSDEFSIFIIDGNIVAFFNQENVSLPVTFTSTSTISFIVEFDGDQLAIYFQDQTVSGSITDSGSVAGSLHFGSIIGSESITDADCVVTNLIIDQFEAANFNYLADPVKITLSKTRNVILKFDPSLVSDSTPTGFLYGIKDFYKLLNWTPIPRDYILSRGYLEFPPIKASFFKMEFTNLVAELYNVNQPIIKTVNLMPNVTVPASNSTSPQSISGSSSLTTVDTAPMYADQVRLPQTTRDQTNYLPTEALISSDPAIANRLAQANAYHNYVSWQSGDWGIARFTATQPHVYRTQEIEHSANVAFFVGLKTLRMCRADFAASEDTPRYVETFDDKKHIVTNPELGSAWVIANGAMTTPETGDGPFEITSTEYKSNQRITGLAFATQQSDAVQQLTDPTFSDSSLSSWQGVGDASVTVANTQISSLGNAVLIKRRPQVNTWSLMENIYSSWNAIEATGSTWNDLETVQPSGSGISIIGGIRGLDLITLPQSGRVYAAVRVYTTKTLSAPLYLQIVSESGKIVSEELVTPLGNQISEWHTSYTIGEGGPTSALIWSAAQTAYPTWNAADNGTATWNDITQTTATLYDRVFVRLVQQEPTLDQFYVDNISLFVDPIVWYFSNDGGKNFYPHYVKNDPHSIFMFPDPDDNSEGFSLVWKAVGYAPSQRVDSLVIRPWYLSYSRGVPNRATIQHSGPNLSSSDHYAAIIDDPMFKMWNNPIPQSWFL